MFHIVQEYLSERFPLVPLLLYTTATMIGISTSFPKPQWILIILLSIIYLLFLFHLRVLDEFKDYEYDSIHHTQRPVQEGLITLSAIKTAGIINLFVLFLLSYRVSSFPVFILFVLTLIYTGFMYKEFFIKDYLKKHIGQYLLSHQLVFIPLFWFFYSVLNISFWQLSKLINITALIYSIIPIVLIEIGRKLKHRYNHKGEKTNDTYVYHWGEGTSLRIFATIIFFSFLLYTYLESNILISMIIFSSSVLIFIGSFAFRKVVIKYSMLITTFLALFLPLALIF